MKKIIWIFGESGTGKLTLIKKILEKDPKILSDLGITTNKIIPCKTTVPELYKDNIKYASFDDKFSGMTRNTEILKEIMQFYYDDNDILLVKGQVNDMKIIYGDTLKTAASLYPDMEKEIYLLEISDLDLHYQRFTNKEWFKQDPEKYSSMFTREWLPDAVEEHRKQVLSYMKFGYDVSLIDSTNDFKYIGKIEKEKSY